MTERIKSFFRRREGSYFTVVEVLNHFPELDKAAMTKLLKTIHSYGYLSKRRRNDGSLNEFAYIDKYGVLLQDAAIYNLLLQSGSKGLHILDIAELNPKLSYGDIHYSLLRLTLDRNVQIKQIGKLPYYRYFV